MQIYAYIGVFCLAFGLVLHHYNFRIAPTARFKALDYTLISKYGS